MAHLETWFGNVIVFDSSFILVDLPWMAQALATECLNKFMRGIYSQDVFMESAIGADLANNLYSFVRSYVYQAAASYKLGLKYFGLYPKLHWVHETAHEMRRQSRMASYILNPAVHSCSLDEDFIGRVAALSREVSPRLVSQRLFERYQAHIQISWARG